MTARLSSAVASPANGKINPTKKPLRYIAASCIILRLARGYISPLDLTFRSLDVQRLTYNVEVAGNRCDTFDVARMRKRRDGGETEERVVIILRNALQIFIGEVRSRSIVIPAGLIHRCAKYELITEGC